MIFERWFRRESRIIYESPAPPQPAAEEEDLAQLRRRAYETFLNAYASTLFDPAEREALLRREFYHAAIELSAWLSYRRGSPAQTDLEAAHMAEEAKARAERRCGEIASLTDEVLIDQRNYLLARHINEQALALGFGTADKPFSGEETTLGAPQEAFVYKGLYHLTHKCVRNWYAQEQIKLV